MMDIVIRSVRHGEIMIKDTLALLEPDLHIITKEGASLRTNKFLISQGSPILRRILNDDHMSPSVLHLPDVMAPALQHLISVIKNGFTTGRGDGYSVIKAVTEATQVMGFENVPVLTFEVERQSQPAELEDLRQNAPEGSHESEMAGEVSTDSGEVDYLIKIEFEDNQEENSSNDEDKSNISSVKKGNVPDTTSFLTEYNHQRSVFNFQAEQNQDEHFSNAAKRTFDQYARISSGIKRIESVTHCFCGIQFEDVKQFKKHSRIFHPLASSHTGKGFTMRSDTSSLNGDGNSAVSIGREETQQYSVGSLCNLEPLYGNSTSKKRGRKHPKELIKNNGADQVLKSKSHEVPINNNDDVEVSQSKSHEVPINNNEVHVQVLKYSSREVTEAIDKVLKKDPDVTDDNLDTSEVILKFQCKPCKKTFSNAATLLVHAENHGESKSRRKCSLCNYSGSRIQLLSHIRGVHSKEKLFECSVCLEKFFHGHARKAH